MPDHVRQQIRTAVAAELAALAGGRVYTTRLASFPAVPAITVTLGDEAIEAQTSAATQYLRRDVELHIDAYASAVADVEDTLDGLCADIEAAISDATFGGLAKAAEPQAISTTFFDADADNQYANLRLTYLVSYATAATAPTVAI